MVSIVIVARCGHVMSVMMRNVRRGRRMGAVTVMVAIMMRDGRVAGGFLGLPRRYIAVAPSRLLSLVPTRRTALRCVFVMVAIFVAVMVADGLAPVLALVMVFVFGDCRGQQAKRNGCTQKVFRESHSYLQQLRWCHCEAWQAGEEVTLGQQLTISVRGDGRVFNGMPNAEHGGLVEMFRKYLAANGQTTF